MKTDSFSNCSLKDIKKIAGSFAKTLKGGELIFAIGELGAGKTTFFKEIGKVLNVQDTINSPTFNLVKIYDGDFKFYHVDCYRFENVDESLKELGVEEEILEKQNIFYVEWPQFAPEAFKKIHPRIEINFKISSLDKRDLVINDERY